MSAQQAEKVKKGRKKQKVLAGVGISLGIVGIGAGAAAGALYFINKNNIEAANKEKQTAHTISVSTEEQQKLEEAGWQLSGIGDTAVYDQQMTIILTESETAFKLNASEIPNTVIINNKFSYQLSKVDSNGATQYKAEFKCPCYENMTLGFTFGAPIERKTLTFAFKDKTTEYQTEASKEIFGEEPKITFLPNSSFGSIAKPVFKKNRTQESGYDQDWNFAGWVDQYDADIPDDTILTQDMTIYPKWLKATMSVNLVFKCTDSTIKYQGYNVGEEPTVAVIRANQEGVEPTMFVKVNKPTPMKTDETKKYIPSTKWFSDSETKQQIQNEQTFNKNQDVYPSFEEIITNINLTTKIDSSKYSDVEFITGSTTKGTTYIINNISPTATYRQVGLPSLKFSTEYKYEFNNEWEDEAGNPIDLDKVIGSNVTICPKIHAYTENHKQIKFNANGGYLDKSKQTTTISYWGNKTDTFSKLTKPTELTKDENSFLGWATTSTATAPDITDGMQIESVADEIFAVWKPDKQVYTLSFSLKEYSSQTEDIHHGEKIDDASATTVVDPTASTVMKMIKKPTATKVWYESEEGASGSKIDWYFHGWKYVKDDTEVGDNDTILNNPHLEGKEIQIYPYFDNRSDIYSHVVFHTDSSLPASKVKDGCVWGNTDVWGTPNTECVSYPIMEGETGIFDDWTTEEGDESRKLGNANPKFPETKGGKLDLWPFFTVTSTVNFKAGDVPVGRESKEDTITTDNKTEVLVRQSTLWAEQSRPTFTYKNKNGYEVGEIEQKTYPKSDDPDTTYTTERWMYSETPTSSTGEYHWIDFTYEDLINVKSGTEDSRFKLDKDYTFKPVWKISQVTFLFDTSNTKWKLKDETGSSITVDYLETNGATLKSLLPTKDDFEAAEGKTPAYSEYFAGWSLDGVNVISDDYICLTSRTLYPIFKNDSSLQACVYFTLGDYSSYSPYITSIGALNQNAYYEVGESGKQIWSTISKVTYVWTEKVMDYYVYKDITAGASTYTKVTSDLTFMPGHTYEIAPHFTSYATNVTLSTTIQEVKVGSSITVTAAVDGVTAPEDNGTFKWEILESKTPEKVSPEYAKAAAIPDTPKATITGVKNATALTDGGVYVKCTWTDAGTGESFFGYLWIAVLDYASTGEGFYVVGSDYSELGGESTDTWEIDQDSLCGTGDIKLTNKTASGEKTISRTEFNPTKITVGRYVSVIPAEFMNGCTAFTGTIDFSHAVMLTTIQEGFMEDCTNSFTFNFNNSPTVTAISSDFMAGCTNFNDGNVKYLIQNARIIGNNFMFSCSEFNQQLTFSDSLYSIGDGFLDSCTKFCQNLTFPESIEYVGDSFLNCCDAMYITTESAPIITINFDISAFENGTDTCFTKFYDGNTKHLNITCKLPSEYTEDEYKTLFEETLFPNIITTTSGNLYRNISLTISQ